MFKFTAKTRQRANQDQPAAAPRVTPGLSLLRKSSILSLQRVVGNRAVSQLVQSAIDNRAVIQANITSSQPGDQHEQQANRLAGQILRLPEARVGEPKAAGQTLGQGLSGVDPVLKAGSGAGLPLSDTTRAFFEARIGQDFSDVRVHSDNQAERLAGELGAEAFTSGTDIWFAASKGPSDKKLLAHELAHVVQQRGGAPSIQKQRATASQTFPRVNVVFNESANRWVVSLDAIPIAEIAVESKETPMEVQVDIASGVALVTVRHHGGAALAASPNPGASLAYSVRLREIDMRQGAGTRVGPREPAVPGATATGLVEITIVPPSAIRWPDEPTGELGMTTPIAPGSLSEFEERLRADPSRIIGVVLDPSNGRDVIGYRVFATAGVTRLVDREGNEVFLDEVGIETPLVDPLDFIPTPGSVGRVGAGIIGRVGIKALGRRAAVRGTRVPLGVIARMRGVSQALYGRALRKGAAEAPGFVRRITQAGLDHSFDRHAAQWFGRAVSRQSHFGFWRELIERVALSGQTFPWSVGAARTIGHLGRVEGKYFVVQFFEETGELATAFVPNASQLREMLKLLRSAP
jgi:Domain of unknown function (DUF4157)